MNKPIYLCFFIIVCIQASSMGQSVNHKENFKIVGYYSLQSAMTVDPDSVPFDKLTHVNLWFLNPDSLGNFNQDLSGLSNFISKAHDQQVKVLVSIGGGSRQSQYRQLLRDSHRKKLIENLVQIVNTIKLDGVDVDLEGDDIDENYEKFVLELAKELKSKDKLITAAIAVYYKEKLTDKALAQYDFVNIMSYDRTGPWNPQKPGPHATFTHAWEDLDYFGNERSIPKEKMVLGVPFYGYGYDLSLGAPATSMNYGEITATFPGSENVDEWEMPDGKILYYNGIHTMKQKTALAKNKASGIMIWQIRGDASEEKSLLNAINETAY